MKRFFLSVLCILPGLTYAQNTLSLQECVDLLIKNNLTYQAGNLQAEAAQAQLRQTRSQIYPQIAIGANQSVNIGRSIDQYTNAYIDEVYGNNRLGVGFDMALYQGGKIQNQIRQGVLLKESAEENRIAVLNNQTVLLMQNYVNVLATNAIWVAATEMVESSKQQVDRISKQVDAGTVGSNLLYEIKAQYANDKFAEVTALNNYRTARLALFQRMNIPPDDKVEFETLNPKDSIVQAQDAGQLYEDATGIFPEIKSAELYRKSFAYQVKSIRSANYPSLTLGGNFGAFYATSNRTLDYFGQLNATRNGYLSVGLNIPIMGRWLTRPRVELAKVQERQAQNTLDVTKQLLRQNIETAVLNLNSMSDRYIAAQGQVESLTAAFAIVESKLNAGMANSFEYTLAKANLAKAQANAIQAKYDYLMQQRLLKYYQQGNWTGVL